MAIVCDIKFNRPNRVYKTGDLTKKNEAPDGYLSRLDRLTNEQIQEKLREQIENPTPKGFNEKTIKTGKVKPLEIEDPIFNSYIQND